MDMQTSSAGTRVRGLIDLRAYATCAAPTSDWLVGRPTPAFVDDAATVVALAPIGEGRVEELRTDEFVIVLSGTLTLKSTRSTTVVEAGRSAVLPAGLSFGWHASEGTLAIIVACPASSGAASDIVRINESAPLAASNPPSDALLVGPRPTCRNHSDYRSNNGEFVCGTWDSTPYHRSAMPYRHIELMHLLDGCVTFQDASGSVTFSKGDIFLAARGAECAWISDVHVKKVYAIHRPA